MEIWNILIICIIYWWELGTLLLFSWIDVFWYVHQMSQVWRWNWHLCRFTIWSVVFLRWWTVKAPGWFRHGLTEFIISLRWIVITAAVKYGSITFSTSTFFVILFAVYLFVSRFQFLLGPTEIIMVCSKNIFFSAPVFVFVIFVTFFPWCFLLVTWTAVAIIACPLTAQFFEGQVNSISIISILVGFSWMRICKNRWLNKGAPMYPCWTCFNQFVCSISLSISIVNFSKRLACGTNFDCWTWSHMPHFMVVTIFNCIANHTFFVVILVSLAAH